MIHVSSYIRISLSIEGYRVTMELIERVRTGDWDPDNHQGSFAPLGTMAAMVPTTAVKRTRNAEDRRLVLEGTRTKPPVADETPKPQRGGYER